MKNNPGLRVALLGPDASLEAALGLSEGVARVGGPADADAVIMGPDSDDAFELAREALTNGQSVLVLAPFTLRPRQMYELEELRRSEGQILRFGEPFRYLGGFPLLQRLLSGPEPFWRPRYLRADWLDAHSGFETLDSMLASELALYGALFDAEPLGVTAAAVLEERSCSPCALEVSVEYAHGPPLLCTVSQAEVDEVHQTVAVASDRMLTLDQRGQSTGLTIVGLERARTTPVLKRVDTRASREDAVAQEVSAFVRAAATRDLTYVNTTRWTRVSSICAAARMSARKEMRVDVESRDIEQTKPPPLTLVKGGGTATKKKAGSRPALTLIAS